MAAERHRGAAHRLCGDTPACASAERNPIVCKATGLQPNAPGTSSTLPVWQSYPNCNESCSCGWQKRKVAVTPAAAE